MPRKRKVGLYVYMSATDVDTLKELADKHETSMSAIAENLLHTAIRSMEILEANMDRAKLTYPDLDLTDPEQGRLF